MPLVTAHAFAVHKGGVGKSTLVFHVACAYAAAHPDQHVLVADMTTLGDVSQLLLGGMRDNAGMHAQLALLEQEPAKNMTALLEDAAVAPLVAATDSSISGLFNKLRLGSGGASSAADGSGTPLVDFRRRAVRPADHNAHVPANLWLVPGGPTPDTLRGFTLDQQTHICEALNQSLRASAEPWKVFYDCDGDLAFAPYTRIAIRASEGLVVPLEASSIDFKRVETFLVELDSMYTEYKGKVGRMQMMVWNKIDVQTYKPCPPVSSSLTPTKAVQDKVSRLNNMLAAVASRHPSIFQHPVPEGRDTAAFIAASSMCMQLFGVAGDAAQDLGLPFCTMRPGRQPGGEHEVSAEKLRRVQANIEELSALL